MTDLPLTPRFAAGTFTAQPKANSPLAMLRAQTRLELVLLLRNGEQLLLTMFIPITLLIGLCLLPLGSFADPRPNTFVPAVMTVAIMSTAFTGQAIAVGFDRRYGALKRIGATALPRWGILGGKSAAVTIVVALQSVILGAIGFALGWRPSLSGLILGAIVIAIGTVTFAALGLLLGGSLKAEVILALANLLWFIMLGVASLTLGDSAVPHVVDVIVRLTPSGALVEALTQATSGAIDLFGVVVLLVWAAVAAALAVRTFKFE